MENTAAENNSADRELSITRLLNAPGELVWRGLDKTRTYCTMVGPRRVYQYYSPHEG